MKWKILLIEPLILITKLMWIFLYPEYLWDETQRMHREHRYTFLQDGWTLWRIQGCIQSEPR